MVPLTTSHFIVGSLGGDFVPEISKDEAKTLIRRLCWVQQLLGQFWRRWRGEFLPSLNSRGKWFETKRKFEEDAVVIVTYDAKRHEWPISRIVKTHLGKDGLVRVVDIQTGKTTYVRPVHHQMLLESMEDWTDFDTNFESLLFNLDCYATFPACECDYIREGDVEQCFWMFTNPLCVFDYFLPCFFVSV